MPSFLEFFLYPLFVAAVVGGVTLFFRDRKSLKEKVDKLNSRMNWLIGDEGIKDDTGKIGEIQDSLKIIRDTQLEIVRKVQ